MIATLRMLSRCCITPLYHVDVRCPRCGGQSVRRSSRVGAFERLISSLYVYPFRCQRCSHRFRALNWGHRYPHPKGERRDYERVAVRLPARLTAGTESADAETTDLSVSGCAVRTDARFPPGTEVRFTVKLGASGGTVEIAEAVVRAINEGRVSLQFVHVGVDEQRRLAEYIQGVALPISGGRPGRRPSFPIEVVLVAVAGLLVIFLILSMVTRIGITVR
ncbi:MAG: hypothetical protein DMD76_22385 [Candidatus Rokuibacteriota bacterium]|nr:MAG: hypothetical protein DMD76_22385 [Candidatus Rokubacteria bacterium]